MDSVKRPLVATGGKGLAAFTPFYRMSNRILSGTHSVNAAKKMYVKELTLYCNSN